MNEHLLEINNTPIKLSETTSGVYHGEFRDISFQCRRWTWGEKNQIFDLATRYHQPSQSYYQDTIVHNENMVNTCVTSLTRREQPVTLAEMDANDGDLVLEVCMWVNRQSCGIPEDYQLRPQNDLVVVDAPPLQATFKKWTWGEKMAAIKAASVYNPQAEEMQLRNGKFSELLLVHSLQSLRLDDHEVVIDHQGIQNLPAAVGELLIDVAVQLNSVSDAQKKT